MSYRVINSIAEWEACANEWRAMADSAPGTTPFQLPEWQLTWWKHFGSGHLQVLWSEAGIVPLFQHEWNGRNQLTLIGSGLADWTDPIQLGDLTRDVNDYLRNNAEVELCDWQDLSCGSPLTHIDGMQVREDMSCMQIAFPSTWDEYWSLRGKDLKRNVRRYGERARAAGSVELQVIKEAEPELLNALIRLHTNRWRRQGESGMIAANHAHTFLKDVAAAFAQRDMLRIFVLRWSGDIVALVLTFVYRNTVFAYMSGFDPEHESLGFGRTLLFESFRYCFGVGYKAWNFLRGTEPYKASWGAELIPKIRLYKER